MVTADFTTIAPFLLALAALFFEFFHTNTNTYVVSASAMSSLATGHIS
jgi:hypothetical protein